MSNLYFRFLQIANAIQKASLPALDENSMALLNTIALKHSQGEPMTVSQAMGLAALGSQSTLHRRLDALRVAGFIDQVPQGLDRQVPDSHRAGAGLFFEDEYRFCVGRQGQRNLIHPRIQTPHR